MAMTLMQIKAQFADPMRQGISTTLWEASQLFKRLNFIQHSGLSYPYTQTSKLPAVGTRNINGTFTASDGVETPFVEGLTVLGGKIQTDSVIISIKGEAAARANRITKQMMNAGKMFDRLFLVGDPTVAGKTSEIRGLKARITAGTQLLTQATNGAVVTWEKVQALLAAVTGPNSAKKLFMNQTTRLNLQNDTLADEAGKALWENRGGVFYFDGAEIVEVYNDETETAILGFTETCGTATTCCSVYCARLGGSVDEDGVQGITGLPQIIEASGPFAFGEYTQDVVQMVAGIGIFGGYQVARLQGVKAA